MKFITEIAEEESRRIFWVIQTIFGFIIAHSFYSYASIFIPPYNYDIITVTLALVSIYTCILWSWIDFSFTLIVAPYQFKDKPFEKFRFVSDLLIVLVYTYFLVYIDFIKGNPDKYLIEYYIAFIVIFIGYSLSGILRIVQYGRRASRIWLIVSFLIINIIIAISYSILFGVFDTQSVFINRIYFVVSIIITIIYRIVRFRVSKRKYTIAIDVDGVLADQIAGIIPIVKNEHKIDLQYEDIISWNLKIKKTSIDKIIINEQKERGYVLGMPMHAGAYEIVNKLIKHHYIAIATARPIDSDHWTKEWLNNNKIPYDSYHNLKESGKHNASENFNILIDDYIGNIKSFLDKHDGKAILFSQPWNQKRTDLMKYIDEGRLIVVTNWQDIPESINDLLKHR